MKIGSENFFYDYANNCMAKSLWKYDHGERVKSWLYTIPARLSYLVDIIVDIVALPFVLIGLVFGLLHATFTCSFKNNKLLSFYYSKMKEKVNHFFLSAFGAVLSPAIAHKHRDFNAFFYFAIIRGTVMTVAAGVWAYRHFSK